LPQFQIWADRNLGHNIYTPKNLFPVRATFFKEIVLSNVYQAIANLDSNEEKTVLLSVVVMKRWLII